MKHAIGTALGWIFAICVMAVLIPALFVAELWWKLRPKRKFNDTI